MFWDLIELKKLETQKWQLSESFQPIRLTLVSEAENVACWHVRQFNYVIVPPYPAEVVDNTMQTNS